MLKKNHIILMFLVIGLVGFTACTTKEKPSDDLIPGILSNNAELTLVTSGVTFNTAGSPLYLNGNLYFTNNNFESPEVSRTFRMNSDGVVDTLASDNGVTTTLWASLHGTIYACEMLGHRVVELDRDGKLIKVIAGSYNGNRIDGPNDLVIDSHGGLYFTDSQFIAGRDKMQETTAIYYVKPDGEITRVADDVDFPNGLVISPDGSRLYVANTPGSHLLIYDINADGSLSNRSDFAALKLTAEGEPGGADGMAIDRDGNVYVATTRGLGVQIFNNQGTYLGSIEVPTPTNNVSFGGADKKTLYISAVDGIYSIPVSTAGHVLSQL
jgi:gluconolactonase